MRRLRESVEAKIHYMINLIWFFILSFCIKKKKEIYILNTSVFYMIFDFKSYYKRKDNCFTDNFQGFCLDFKNAVLVRFFKAICFTFLSLHDRDNTFQRLSTSWYPAISSSVFSVLIGFAIFTSLNLIFFLLLCFLKFTIHFVLKIYRMFISNFWLVKNTSSITFREKIT